MQLPAFIGEQIVPLAMLPNIIIEEEEVPLADTITIMDEDVPLASMPNTGDRSVNPLPFAALGVAAFTGAFIANKRLKKGKIE